MLTLASPSLLLAVLLACAATLRAEKCTESAASSVGADRDRRGLLTLRDAVQEGGFGRSRLQEWFDGSHPCGCDPWPHVTCSGDRVTQLDLSNSLVEGVLPVELRELDALQKLYLQGNRFSGVLPAEWGEPLYFPSLQQLDLSSNLLNSTLPNRKWNSRDSWPALTKLNLASNYFYGGLPDGWLGSERPFPKLTWLDLSDNKLGYTDGGAGNSSGEASQLQEQADWCLPGDPPASAGWCAPQLQNGTAAARLEFLDLSGNGLQGELPASWPSIFLKLHTLRLQGNKLSVQPAEEAEPSPLPPSWTSPDLAAFPELDTLVIYPGNDLICSVLSDEGFMDININRTYLVQDDSGSSYDAASPWLCPGPSGDNPPTITSLTLDPSTQAVRLAWAPPAENAGFVWGYRLSIEHWDPDAGEYELVPGWASVLLRTVLDARHAELPEGVTKAPEGDGYVLELKGYRGSGKHLVKMASYNVNAWQSSEARLEAELGSSPVLDQ